METEKPSGTNKQGEREIVQLLFRITSFYLAIYCIYGITQNSLYYPRFFSVFFHQTWFQLTGVLIWGQLLGSTIVFLATFVYSIGLIGVINKKMGSRASLLAPLLRFYSSLVSWFSLLIVRRNR